jgi:hypothetical protein
MNLVIEKAMFSLILISCLIPIIGYSQTDDKLGIGVLKLSYPSNELNFYNDTINLNNFRQIPFSKSETNIKIFDKIDWLLPVQFFVTDEFGSITNFEILCLEKRNTWYRVSGNTDSNKIYWLKNDSLLSFYTWNDLLNEMFCIRRVDSTDKIYKLNSLQSDTIPYFKDECFRVLEINGYWMKIGCYPEYDNSKDASNQPGIIDLGWILWRNENSLLIQYYDN